MGRARRDSVSSPVQRRLDGHLALVVVLRIVVASLTVAGEAVAPGGKALAVELEAPAIPAAKSSTRVGSATISWVVQSKRRQGSCRHSCWQAARSLPIAGVSALVGRFPGWAARRRLRCAVIDHARRAAVEHVFLSAAAPGTGRPRTLSQAETHQTLVESDSARVGKQCHGGEQSSCLSILYMYSWVFCACTSVFNAWRS